MPQTQKFIITLSALVIGVGLGLFLSTVFTASKVEAPPMLEEIDPMVATTSNSMDAVSGYDAQLPDAAVANGAGVACAMDARICSDGVAVGRVGETCEFAPCPDEVQYKDEEVITVTCTPERKNNDVCAEIYAPVCASVQVECVTTPCNPVPETYPNGCSACSEDRVISYTEGECTS